MHLNLLNAFLLFGIIQGAILIVVFMKKNGQPSIANRLISGIILALILATLGIFLGSALEFYSFSTFHLLIIYFPFHLIMALGPLLYFYCHSLFEKGFKLKRSSINHFFPVILDVFPFCVSIFIVIKWQLGLMVDSDINNHTQILNQYNTYVDVPRFISLSFYLYYCWRYLRSNKIGSNQNTFVWCRKLLWGMTIIVLIWFPYLLLYISPWQKELLRFAYYFPVYFPVVGMLYFLSFQLMFKNISLRSNPISTSLLIQKADDLVQVIEEEQLYLIPDLRLNELAARLELPEKKLSFLLNHHIKKGFNDFINEFRINEAKRQISNRAHSHLTLEGIALDVGFSSRATFYRAFKKVTGEQPTEYIKKLK